MTSTSRRPEAVARPGAPLPVRAVRAGGGAAEFGRQETQAAGLWAAIAGMGWIGAAIRNNTAAPASATRIVRAGGRLGRVVAPRALRLHRVPGRRGGLLAGSEAQKREFLPQLADGSLIGCFALARAPAIRTRSGARARPEWAADRQQVARRRRWHCRSRGGRGALMNLPAVQGRDATRRDLTTLDPTRNRHVWISRVAVEKLGQAAGWPLVQRLLDRRQS